MSTIDSNTQAGNSNSNSNTQATSPTLPILPNGADASILGEFRPYDSQLPIPVIDGYRVAKMLYAENKKTGTKAGENSYIYVADGHLSESVILEPSNIKMILPHIRKLLETVENKYLKERHSKDKADRIMPNELGMSHLLELLATENAGARLNKEDIKEWFKSDVEAELMILIASKLGIDIAEASDKELEKVIVLCGVYKAKFLRLVVNTTSFPEAEAEALINVLDKTGASMSTIGTRFRNRLIDISKKADDLMMDL